MKEALADALAFLRQHGFGPSAEVFDRLLARQKIVKDRPVHLFTPYLHSKGEPWCEVCGYLLSEHE